MLVNKKYIHLGKGAKIDNGAIIGYKPLRKLPKMDLYIGSGLLAMRGSVIYAGSKIGDRAIIGHNSIVREQSIIGNEFSLWANSVVDYGCSIGNKAKVHCNVYVAQFTEIEDEVFIGPGTIIANDLHPGCEFSKRCMKGPCIKKGAVIGVNVTINPFVVVGENAVIGSGSVVTKDIPDGMVAYGNPARIVGDITDLKCHRHFTDFPYKATKKFYADEI